MVFFLPILFALLFAGLQGAFWYHARTVAIAAAQEGARVAAAEHGTLSDGLDAASSFASDVGAGALTGVGVTGQRTVTTATITVTGTSRTLLPGWDSSVSQTASLAVERLT